MLKLVGILIITIACSVLGFECSSELRRRERSLRAFVRLFDSLESSIRAFSTPLRDFFAGYRDEWLERVGFCENTAKTLDLGSTVRACADVLCLSSADIALLEKAGEGLGTLGAEREAKRCGYCKGELERQLSELKRDMAAKTRLYNTLGITCGVLAAVILI